MPTSSDRADALRAEGADLYDEGRVDDAVAALRRALLADPRHVPTLQLLARVLRDAGRLREALARIDSLVRLTPSDADVHRARALVLHGLGKGSEAIASLERAVALSPSDAEARRELGDLLLGTGRADAAATQYRAAIALAPSWSAPRVNLAATEAMRGNHAAAIAAYRDVLADDPINVEAANGLGAALLATGDHVEAVAQLRAAALATPSHVLTRLNLGRALRETGDAAAAVDTLRGVVADRDAFAEGWDELAMSLRDAGDADGAIGAARRAAACDPRRALSFVHLGNLLAETNAVAAAEEAYRRALRLDPALPAARWNLALVELATGAFERGWDDYEARWSCDAFPSPRRVFDAPPAPGIAGLAGKRVLVHAEQGLGDTIHFVRFVPQLAEAGASIVLEVQPPLATLLDGFAGTSAVIAQGQALPAFDFHVPLMSLPRLLRRPEPDATSVPYIASPGQAPAESDGRRRVGIVWAGSRRFVDDRRRSLALDDVVPLFAQRDIDWHGLQKEIAGDDEDRLRALAADAPHLSDGVSLADFADTAARIATLDLVVGVDTAVIHLAGAMGKPVWVLLPFAADFRWMIGRDDSAWYPTARLFRQTTAGRWDDVIARVRAALARAAD